ncbi:MAG: hypothetical protein AAF705_15195 [Bacteroidota bacterium]
MQQPVHFYSFLTLLVLFLSLPKSEIAINDEDTQIEIKTIHSEEGLLEGYQAYIKTPVCETETCYIVQINFTWDIIGRYQKFDTIRGEGLTKLDHIPFTETDYQKLDQLLKDAKSPLANYKKEDLVRDTRSSAIDGFTGATVLEIKERVIEGGVYSCFTLWHLAHGSLVDSLQNRTANLLDSALVAHMVTKEDQDMSYFLLQQFSEQDYLQYLPQFLKTFEYGSGYYAKNALEKMPPKVFALPITQDFFATQFERLNYFAQVALLKKLQGNTISPSLKNILEAALDKRNSVKNTLIQKLLET